MQSLSDRLHFNNALKLNLFLSIIYYHSLLFFLLFFVLTHTFFLTLFLHPSLYLPFFIPISSPSLISLFPPPPLSPVLSRICSYLGPAACHLALPVPCLSLHCWTVSVWPSLALCGSTGEEGLWVLNCYICARVLGTDDILRKPNKSFFSQERLFQCF